MKKIIGIIAALIVISSSCKDDKETYDNSLLVGRWKIVERKGNGVIKPLIDECERDRRWDFAADGSVQVNNPCTWMEEARLKTTWSIDGDILRVNGAIQINAVTKILKLTATELVLERAYGSVDTFEESYLKTDEAYADYAADASGEFIGEAYYGPNKIDAGNLPNDFVIAKIIVNKMDLGRVGMEFQDFNLLGKIDADTLRYNKVKANRSWGTYLDVSTDVPPIKIVRGGKTYDLTLQRTYYKNGVDSIYTTIWIRGEKDDAYSQFQYFRGARKYN